MQKGDIVFFNKAKTKPIKSFREVKFEGHAFGVMLGHVPSNCITTPPASHIFKLMGTIGFITFDDVAEFLTPEQAEICIKKFEEKYYNTKELAEKPAEPVAAPEIKEQSLILDPTGVPTQPCIKLVES